MSRYTQPEREVLRDIAKEPYGQMYRMQDTCEVVQSLFTGAKFAHSTEKNSLGAATIMVQMARMEEFVPFLTCTRLSDDSDCWMCGFDPSLDPARFEDLKSRFIRELNI